MNAPQKPLLVYDGQCAFCRMWIERWKTVTGDAVDYATSADYATFAIPPARSDDAGPTDVAAGTGTPAFHPAIAPEEFRKSVVLILPDGSHLTGARAVLTAIGTSTAGRILLFLYNTLSGFREIADAAYRSVAGHRDEMYLVTRVLWGKSVAPHGFAASRWFFLRGMAVVYGIAFASLGSQILGLIGSGGISPAAMFLDAVHEQLGSAGALLYPTLAWFDPGDGFLTGLCVAGMASSGLLLLGILPRFSAFACWAFYFSLVVAGQVFLRFQWDVLLLEAGFLTIFFAPPGFLRSLPDAAEPPRLVRWLLWLLVFRLMFMSGVVKLAAGDPNWWNLSALSFHYQTQCLPTPPAWYAHRLPLWFHEASAFAMFLIEIGGPLLFFAPRRLRHLGAFLLVGLQALIILTGNFAFFNWLSIVLCLLLLDDGVTSKLVPRFLARRMAKPAAATAQWRPPGTAAGPSALRRLHGGVAMGAFSLMLLLNFNQIAGLALPRSWWPAAVASVSAWASHYNLVNGYGLFRVMTTKRPEIVLEGSYDRTNWTPYEFRYKPGDVSRPLPWVAPHQPRLDWQMWFAALGDYQENGWLVNLAIRLMEKSPEVTALLEGDPFPDRPPAFVRALLYEYRYSTPAERAATGATWVRTLNSVYMPPFSLDGR